MKRFAIILAFGTATLWAQAGGGAGATAPGGTANPGAPPTQGSQTGTPGSSNQNKGTNYTGTNNNGTRKNKKGTNSPTDPGVKAPITNPANGPAGTPTNPGTPK